MSVASRLVVPFLDISAILLLLTSLAELILAGIVQHRLDFARAQGYDKFGSGVPTTSSNETLPPYVMAEQGVENYVTSFSAGELAVATVTLVFSAITIGWAVLSVRRKPQTPYRVFSIALCLFAAVVILLNTGVLAWIFTVHDGPGSFGLYPPQPPQPNSIQEGIFDVGWGDTIDWEKCVCTIAPAVQGYEGGHWFATSCTYNIASRWTLVPLFVLSFSTGVLLWAADGSSFPTTQRDQAAMELKNRSLANGPAREA